MKGKICLKLIKDNIAQLPIGNKIMLIEFIKSLDFFPEDEIPAVSNYFTQKELKSGEYLVQEGETYSKLSFIGSGAFHLYRTINEEKITIRFACKGSFVSAYSSFIRGSESKESILCIQDATIWTINQETITRLSSSSLPWSKLIGLAADIQYLELEKYTLDKHLYSAKERYDRIVKAHPECILETPLKHLASYLAVSPRHLSRLRKT